MSGPGEAPQRQEFEEGEEAEGERALDEGNNGEEVEDGHGEVEENEEMEGGHVEVEENEEEGEEGDDEERPGTINVDEEGSEVDMGGLKP